MRGLMRLCLVLCAALPVCADAQLLPPVVPQVPLPVRVPDIAPVVRELPARAVQSVRDRTRALLRQHPRELDRDRRGAPVVRAVIVALSPDEAALRAAQDRGYVILEDQTLPLLEQRVVTLRVPEGTGMRDALEELREADPSGQYDFDHLYLESGAAPGGAAVGVPEPVEPVDIRVGLIDGGVDASHAVFAKRRPQQLGCNGHSVPSAHGTAVASLFVGWSERFAGSAPGAQLLAVDVYCGGDAPGGRMRDVVGGLAELAAAQVRVINLSIVGPDNAVLASVVKSLLARSILLVAASGNDGPGADPLYPAAYPGVIAVSAVDARRRVLPEASGGRHVSFAAPGADMIAAVPGDEFGAVRGTSYAAPLVAGVIARRLAAATDPAQLITQLVAQAEDRGTRGRDKRYGHGLLATEYRTDPGDFMARPTK